MKVLIIDNYDSFVYNLVQLIEETELCDLEILSYEDVNDGLIDRFDKFVISPGPGIPDDFPKLEELVRKFYRHKDILGICLGYEAIAIAFGGKIISSGKVFHGYSKKTRIVEKDSYIFKNTPEDFNAGCYHSWILERESFPEELTITAIAEDGVIMAFNHRTYNVAGFQYHPESIMTNHGIQMITNWLNR